MYVFPFNVIFSYAWGMIFELLYNYDTESYSCCMIRTDNNPNDICIIQDEYVPGGIQAVY